ncbi:MAG: ABC transporter permease, partial [Rikenellaceae bacterium]
MINTTRIAASSLLRNKMRAFLTMLGIIIGIASVISLVSIGESATGSVKNEIGTIGTNMITIFPKSQNKGGVNMGFSDNKSLTFEDVTAIRNEAKLVADVSPSVSASGQLISGSQNHPSSLQGVDASYFNIRNINIEKGTLFNSNDVEKAAKVCVVGRTIVKELFPDNASPIGEIIRFKGIPLKIIGITEEKGYNQMGRDQDDVVYLPYTTVQRRMLAITHVQMIYASAIEESKSAEAVVEITKILQIQHKLKPLDEPDFEIRTLAEMLSMISSVTGMMTFLLVAIAGISLLVGGIGIMNIMYVTVTERTKEIGLRMSIGARGSNIMMQFLTESVILSLIGGFI